MTILVTGATGYIGSRVVLQLAKRNLEIIAADLDMGKNKDKLEKKYIAAGHDLNLLKFEKLDITNLENAIVTLKSLLLIHRQKNESNDKQLALTYCQKAAQRANELIRMSKHPDIILAFNYTKRCRQIDENPKMSLDKYFSQLTPIKYSQLQKGN